MSSKSKGDTFERKIAKTLGEWWGYKFNRTPQSGGASWGAQNNAVGDIVTPPNAEFPLVIECKHRENWTMDNILLNNKEPHTWWQQVIRDSEKVDKVPCLIFTRNRAKDYVALPYVESFYNDLRDKDFSVMRTSFITTNLKEEKFYYDVLITTIEGLTHFKPCYIKSCYNKMAVKPYKSTTKATSSVDEDAIIDNLLDNI